MRADKDRQ
ncbi:hypothetical protein YPPY15_1598, partial [Yersinia pestis PY-15]